MIRFEILVFCLATRCFLQLTTQQSFDGIKGTVKEIQDAIVDISSQLKIFYNNFMSNGNIPEEEMPKIIETRASKIIARKNLHAKIVDTVHFISFVTLLDDAGFKIGKNYRAKVETNVTESEVRSLLKMMVDLRTVLPTNRAYVKAINRTATYALKNENLLRLFLCFTSPEDDRVNRVTDGVSLHKFTEFVYPYWVETFVDLVREDARLNSEFERPLRSGTEIDLFTMADDKDVWSAPIVTIFSVLVPFGDLSKINDKNYLLLRAVVHVANEGIEEATQLNFIFWQCLMEANPDKFFEQIAKSIETNTALGERIEKARKELDILKNVHQEPSILVQHSEL